ncbi:formylmethanofuran--tetrahydromethanopterin N-formyltransferase [Candidatus Bathyarchaeota archaeon]|nr:formylmethanofuran--tetrahydromethanopterin N-formyltransferase [Candidatus Bathyarchaeota archaeon]MBS7629030.1 formylmethanofuran--tetrahydromethanopterin N-formyltransferase [Candidatus Bathyarchaeota archaeon]
MIVGRILITAENERWANLAANSAVGFASSIIMSPAEAGVEGVPVPPSKTPDGRPGVNIQIYHRTGRDFKMQMVSRIGQCILTCPTTSAFDSMYGAKKRLKIGRAIRLFGDGYQKKDTLGGRTVWRIPVMEGEFIIEDKFGVRRGVAGGNFIIMAETYRSGLTAAERAVEAIRSVEGVVTPFPGGICRSGSKVGSNKYKLPASTNHPFCPTLKEVLPESKVPDGVNSVYEIVLNGIDLECVKRAMSEGIRAASSIEGVRKITAVNFEGRLGPFKIPLREILS